MIPKEFKAAPDEVLKVPNVTVVVSTYISSL